MRSTLLVAGLLFLPAAHGQEIYKWVDKDGIVHYSDQPGSPDAKPVHVSVPRDADAAPAPAYSPSYEPPPLDTGYRGLTIAAPAPDSSYFGADARVPVALRLDGELRPGHSVVVYVDGTPAAGVSGLSGELSGLGRGAHTLRASVRNEAGRELIASGTITFYIQLPSIARPPVGPALKPPPKPPPKPPTHNRPNGK